MKVIRIGPLNHQVEYVSDLKNTDGQGLFGKIDYGEQIISIEQEMSPVRQTICAWHEALHEIDNCCQLGLSEQTVATLATMITRLIQDNPELVHDLIA